MNMPKSRDIQAKIPSPKVIYASNESKSVLARNLDECRDNDKNSRSVFLSFKCILARNCEGTEQLRYLEEVLRYFKDSKNLLTSNIIRHIVLNEKQHKVGKPEKGMREIFS